MKEGAARIIFTQAVKVERGAAVLRIVYFLTLCALYFTFRDPAARFNLQQLLALLSPALLSAYSLVVLILIARNSFHHRLGHLSAALDAVGAGVFFGLFLGYSQNAIGGILVLLAEVYFLVPLITSVAKVKPTQAVSSTLFSFTVSGLVVLIFLFMTDEGALAGHALFLPVVLLLGGFAFWFIPRSFARLINEHMVTEDLERSSRRMRLAMEIVQISIMNLSEFVNNLERITNTLYLGAHNQAKSIEQIGSAAETLKAAMGGINEATNRSAGSLKQTLEISTQGNQSMRMTIAEIADIHEVAAQMDSSLDLINEISDQTNLLALNAAIETSRLGDETSGFSVVAAEIRTLAERSAETAGEISRLVKQMEKVIYLGAESSREAGKIFDRINGDLGQYADFIKGLNTSVQEQLGANRAVSDSLEKIYAVTLDNSNAADHVREVIGELKKEVGKLKALVDGKLVETHLITHAGKSAL